MNDHEVAAVLARGAMQRLLALRHRFADDGLDPTERGRPADDASNAWLLARLGEERPDDAVLSEESPDDGSRLQRSRVWIIDPLDGTREFAEPGRTDWAVHVALSVDGRPEVGAVALPDGALWCTEPTPHAVRADRSAASPRMVVSRSRPPELAARVATRVGAELLTCGSAGAKVAAVLSGQAELYLHAGGMRQWDSCAPVAVALAAGLHASRIDGGPLRYNEAELEVPDLLVCRPELADVTLAAIAQLTA
jgi:3'(2'), 5'-bisphosphate nucleotidase